jgi:hypothetical protein
LLPTVRYLQGSPVGNTRLLFSFYSGSPEFGLPPHFIAAPPSQSYKNFVAKKSTNKFYSFVVLSGDKDARINK